MGAERMVASRERGIGRRMRSKSGAAVVAGGALGLAAALAMLPVAARAQQPDAALIAKGKYLADAGDCAACHTADGGAKFAGGRYMPTPFGPLSTPNITPDKQTGIGNITDDQFYRVFHQGIGMKGEYLYPVMPFPWYTRVRRDDVMAIKAYLFSLAPVHNPRPPIKLAFPFNVRTGLAVWDAMFFTPGTFKPDPSKSAQINRGAYLVEGLEHCGECHNKRNLTGNSSINEPLQGGPIQKWYAPNITSDVHEGIGRFTDDQIFTYLKTGSQTAMGVVAGPMSETVHESLRKLTDDDLHDIVAYLKSTPAKTSYEATHPSDFASAKGPGSGTYLTYCASCHQLNGRGIAGSVPPLAGNGAVIAAGPQDVIRVILGGLEAQGTYAPMPGIGASMTDQQIADVTNYVRQSWGNAAPANAGAGEVGTLRERTHTLMNFTRPDGCPGIADETMSQAINGNGIPDMMKGITLVNMVPTVDQIIAKVKASAPKAPQADIVNSLTIAYCPIIAADPKVPAPQKVVQLDQFGERVYTQLMSHGQE